MGRRLRETRCSACVVPTYLKSARADHLIVYRPCIQFASSVTDTSSRRPDNKQYITAPAGHPRNHQHEQEDMTELTDRRGLQFGERHTAKVQSVGRSVNQSSSLNDRCFDHWNSRRRVTHRTPFCVASHSLILHHTNSAITHGPKSDLLCNLPSDNRLNIERLVQNYTGKYGRFLIAGSSINLCTTFWTVQLWYTRCSG